jgi:hypothetical protein
MTYDNFSSVLWDTRNSRQSYMYTHTQYILRQTYQNPESRIQERIIERIIAEK